MYFALPSQLNDPFDCQIDVRKSAQHAISRMSGNEKDTLEHISKIPDFFDDIQSRLTKIGVCSFSLTLEEPVLWSHYADEHKGVCLLYQFTEEFLTEPSNRIVGVTDVTYGENSLSDWFIEQIPEEIEDRFYDVFPRELLKRVLLVKGAAWEYEKEARIIRENEGPFDIPRDCLKQVCFGLNTSDSDESLVRQIVDRSGYTVNFCKIVKGDSDFGLTTVETYEV